MRRIFSLIFLLITGFTSYAQDDCSNAVTLCANNLLTRTTVGATPGLGDPSLSCGDNSVNNNVWFRVVAINNGSCTVTVTSINNNPGLEMEIYTGICGALTTTGNCTSGSSATGGSMSLTFATIAGTVYYIMVDGTAGNAEAFNITATTSNDAIVSRPDANFNTNPASGCIPLPVQLENTTTLHGGTNIIYEWKIDTGSYIPASGADTTIVFTTTGTHTVTLRVCNTECGCKTISQDVIVQDLYASISFLPSPACVGTDITFMGDANVLPDPPFVDPNIVSWEWNFGDPASGAANTASGQIVNHTFGGPGTSFTVTLIADGACGPDTVTSVLTLNPKPVIDAGGPLTICEGSDATLNATVQNATPPITWFWAGTGNFSCTSCSNPVISSLPPGGPYNEAVFIQDSLGCIADTSVDITVNPRPQVMAGSPVQACRYDSVSLSATPVAGTPPFTYSWSPAAGLDNPSSASPIAVIQGDITYCVTLSDSAGCVSFPECTDIQIYPDPVIDALVPVQCATSPVIQNTFTVSGAGIGSGYSWILSPDYPLISGASADSSSIDVNFPTGVAATYTFTAIVQDAVTGCTDTVSTSFDVISGLTMTVTGPSLICEGDTATLTASGATDYVWTANPVYGFTDSTLSIQDVHPTLTTVYTVFGQAGTCSQVITYTLNVNPRPVAHADTIPSICGCGTVTLDGTGSTTGFNYSWSAAGGSPVSNPSSLVTTSYVCNNEVFVLRVTDPSTGCFRDTSVSVTSLPRPDASAMVIPNQICNGVTTTIILDGSGSNTDPGTTYHWSSNNPGVVITDTTSLFTTADVSTTTIFYLTVSLAGGCDSTVADSVIIFPEPVFTANNPFLCTTDTVLESVLTVNGASPGSVYNWTSIPVCVSPSTSANASETFDFLSCGAGSYPFAVTVTDANSGCVTNLTQSVTVVNGVVLTTTADTAICEGAAVSLMASGANTYQWSTGDSTGTILLSGLTAAASPYSYTVTGYIGSCVSSRTITVTVNPVPATGPIAGPGIVCEGDSGQVYTVTPPGGNYSWILSGGTIVSGQGTDVLTVDWGPAGSGNVSVIDTNSFGCPGVLQSYSVTIHPRPDSSTVVTGPFVVCENSTGTYSVTPNAGSTYFWLVSNGYFPGANFGNQVDITWGPAGTGVVSVYEVNAANCPGPVLNFNVTIHPRPSTILISGSNSVCIGSQAVFSVPLNPGSTLNWMNSGGVMDSLSTGTDSIYISWPTAGNGVVSVLETNSFGCPGDTATFSVLINPMPDAQIFPDSASVCAGSSVLIPGTASNGSVQWFTSGNGTFSDTSVTNPVYTPAAGDTGYSDLMLVVSQSPCPDDTARMALYVAPNPIVTLTAGSNSICFGQSDTLNATGGGNYVWLPGGSTTSQIIVNPLTTTIYTVVVTNSFGCNTIDSITITVIPPGIPNAGLDATVCIGDSIQLNGSQQNAGGVSWTTLGNGTFGPGNTIPSPWYIPGSMDTTTGSVDLVLTTTGACLNLSDTVHLNIRPLPSVYAGTDTVITSGPGNGVAIPLTPVVSNAPGIIWQSSGSGSFSPSDTSLNAVYTPGTSDYTMDSVLLTVTSVGGCIIVTDYLRLDFTPFIIPNVFTPYPGSPGYNDFFVIANLPGNSELKIWDRWGMLVYESSDYLNNWDAAGLKDDTYYYILDTGLNTYKGWVKVIRE